MRLIKGFLLALTGLFIMVTLLSLLIPSRVIVSRGVVINKTASLVFAEISDLHNWKHWQPVFKADSAKINFIENNTGKVDSCEWVSNGKKNIIHITARAENQITAMLGREGENEVTNVISILPLPDSNRVQVEWKSLTKLKWYPWEKFYGIFVEKITGPGYEDALNSLKSYAESH
jgi:hypothetical protein